MNETNFSAQQSTGITDSPPQSVNSPTFSVVDRVDGLDRSAPVNSRQHLPTLVLTGMFLFSGCGSLPLFSHHAVAADPVATRSQSPISKIMGPTERNLKNRNAAEANTSPGESDADLAQARAKFKSAKALYDNGEISESEKAFKSLIKERRDRYLSFGTKVRNFWGVGDDTFQSDYNNFGDPVEEDSIFMLAECQFQLQKYTHAQNSYDDLLNRYPSTRHMDRVTKQMFRIARYWLGFPNDLDKQISEGNVQLASKDDETVDVSAGQDSSSWDIPLVPNLTDRTRPMYDANGRGLLALRSIWLHDATGPLADDALMLAANHNLRVRNFVEAKRLYALLRDQYPDSPHLRDAFLLGSHVTLAAYEGPEYDGTSLNRARDLKQTMLQIFPEMSDKERSMLQSEIDQLHEAEIQRLWSQVEFYQAKRIPESIALHCNLIINRYPNSEYAQRSRLVLQDLQENSQRSGQPLWAWGNGQKPAVSTPAQVKDNQADPRLQAEKTTRPESTDQSEKPKRNVFGFLRRAEEPPQLQTPPTNSEQPGRVSL